MHRARVYSRGKNSIKIRIRRLERIWTPTGPTAQRRSAACYLPSDAVDGSRSSCPEQNNPNLRAHFLLPLTFLSSPLTREAAPWSPSYHAGAAALARLSSHACVHRSERLCQSRLSGVARVAGAAAERRWWCAGNQDAPATTRATEIRLPPCAILVPSAGKGTRESRPARRDGGQGTAVCCCSPAPSPQRRRRPRPLRDRFHRPACAVGEDPCFLTPGSWFSALWVCQELAMVFWICTPLCANKSRFLGVYFRVS
jgi:hypothetical protein